jgi:hypothetical protein
MGEEGEKVGVVVEVCVAWCGLFIDRVRFVVWCGGMCLDVYLCGDGGAQASKADVEAAIALGHTSLHLASEKGHDLVTQLLLVRREGWESGKRR